MATSRGAAPEEGSVERLLPQVYDELLRLARRRLARYGPGESITPAELVHEAYLRLAGGTRRRFEGRPHFFFAMSRTMRDLIVESARRRATSRRGGGRPAVDLYEADARGVERKDFVDLHRALLRLAEHDRECARTVVLSYFVGLTHPEIAEATGVSRATVERRWACARAWLRRELADRA
ncbi:MAG TPA: ECF-type sigma factor [Thermoanaerobaculia bacterium]|nr:ECF-type sigma factor [Thermoanaerobaculia bacterium]